MLEPVNTVLKAVRRLSLLRGDVVLVAGQGPIGLMFTRLLQLAGAQVIATDLLAPRLKLAGKFGAKWTLLASKPDKVGRAVPCPPSDSTLNPQPSTFIRLSSLIHRATRGRGLDAAVIAVPSDAAVQQALQLVRGGGQVLLFAHTKRATPTLNPQPSTLNFPLDLASVCLDEKDLLGSYSSDFTLQDEVARLVFSRRLDVRSLITHRFPLAETAEAVALAAQPTPDSLKIIVGGTACRRP